VTAMKPKKKPIDPANLSASAKNRNKGPSNRPSTTSEIGTSAFQVRRRPVSRECRRQLNAENARPFENKRPAPSKTYDGSTARAYFHLGGLEYEILHGTSVLSAGFLTSDRRTTRACWQRALMASSQPIGARHERALNWVLRTPSRPIGARHERAHS